MQSYSSNARVMELVAINHATFSRNHAAFSLELAQEKALKWVIQLCSNKSLLFYF